MARIHPAFEQVKRHLEAQGKLDDPRVKQFFEQSELQDFWDLSGSTLRQAQDIDAQLDEATNFVGAFLTPYWIGIGVSDTRKTDAPRSFKGQLLKAISDAGPRRKRAADLAEKLAAELDALEGSPDAPDALRLWLFAATHLPNMEVAAPGGTVRLIPTSSALLSLAEELKTPIVVSEAWLNGSQKIGWWDWLSAAIDNLCETEEFTEVCFKVRDEDWWNIAKVLFGNDHHELIDLDSAKKEIAKVKKRVARARNPGRKN
ncbi:hypothetical protein Ga0061069_1077 [Thiomonas bhubaneswarensis]|uniref:Uncharacterized protein n=2 Tax=Thiomonas bhubaneswarensis TaxID=339866 RepID=A0A0K6I544_9BURK|nr:hypothetical protein Ga0061069_1077 [Thiomonas bhubaneswarensis]